MISRRSASVGLAATAAVAAAWHPSAAIGNLQAIDLPAPQRQGGKPLMQALMGRRSTRAYAPRPLPPQLLSDLLWAANGVNRPTADRTAPYWRHIMVIDIYAAMEDGVWLYEPTAHRLVPYMLDDIRADTGLQDFVGTAPLNLIYVAHGERMGDISTEERGAPFHFDAFQLLPQELEPIQLTDDLRLQVHRQGPAVACPQVLQPLTPTLAQWILAEHRWRQRVGLPPSRPPRTRL
jgi:hypothetical protein